MSVHQCLRDQSEQSPRMIHPVVNRTWLEDYFFQWRILTVGLEKYIVFPPGVNFRTLLGEQGVRIGQNIERGRRAGSRHL